MLHDSKQWTFSCILSWEEPVLCRSSETILPYICWKFVCWKILTYVSGDRHILFSFIPGEQLLNHYSFYYINLRKYQYLYRKDEDKYRRWMVPLNNAVLIVRRMQKWPFLWECGILVFFFQKIPQAYKIRELKRKLYSNDYPLLFTRYLKHIPVFFCSLRIQK